MIRLMELTMNQANMNLGNANAEWGSTGWRMPEFGFQKYVAEACLLYTSDAADE